LHENSPIFVRLFSQDYEVNYRLTATKGSRGIVAVPLSITGLLA